MRTAIVTCLVLCCALACTSSMATPNSIQLDFSADSQGYGGANWDWAATEGIPAGSMRQLGDSASNTLTKTAKDRITIITPAIMSVSASFWAMGSSGMGAVDMNYLLTYSDDSTDMRTISIAPIGGQGNEWKSVDEAFVTPKPLKSILLLSFSGTAPDFGPTHVYLDTASISASAVPEPSALVSLLSLCGLAASFRRRK